MAVGADVTDWPAIIAHLEQRMRHIDIATYVERSEGWVGLLKRGVIKQPPYEQGRLLIELAHRHGYVSQRTQDPQVQVSENA